MYYYCMVKTKLKLNKNGNMILDLPCSCYSAVGVLSGGGYLDGKQNDKTNVGEDVLAYIHVKEEDKETIKSFIDFVGETEQEVLNYNQYVSFYPFTVKQLKNECNINGEITKEYKGKDSNSKALFCKM